MLSKKLSSEAVQIWPIYASFLLLLFLLVSKYYFSGFTSKYTFCISFDVVLCFVPSFYVKIFRFALHGEFFAASVIRLWQQIISICIIHGVVQLKLQSRQTGAYESSVALCSFFVFRNGISHLVECFSLGVCQRWIEMYTQFACVCSQNVLGIVRIHMRT